MRKALLMPSTTDVGTTVNYDLVIFGSNGRAAMGLVKRVSVPVLRVRPKPRGFCQWPLLLSSLRVVHDGLEG